MAGSASGSGDTITVRGAGIDIGGTSDQFHWAFRTFADDIDLIVLVKSIETTNPSAKAGLMIRDSLAANARFAFISASAGNQASFQTRSRTGASATTASTTSVSSPIWLRLSKNGNALRAYTSINGSAWTQIGSATMSMRETIYVGFAVTSRDANQHATATVSSSAFVSAPPPITPLPAPWQARDIGSPSVAGTASAANGVFTVRGAGADIGSTTDQFQFVYQPVTGDTQIVARVASLQAVDAWTKGGIMIRESLSANAAHASLIATGANGWGFQRRPLAGGPGSYTAGDPGTPPGFVKLIREGNLITAYVSPTGVTWELLDRETVTMPSTVYVGLAVTSHNPSATATASFSNVVVSSVTTTNKIPTVILSIPVTTFIAPATINLTASASDSDGTIARVDFYANSQLIGSDTSSPYSVTWGGVPAGSFYLTAVATDNKGAAGYSNLVTFTVSGQPPPVPSTKLTFAPSIDYSTNVTSCTVALRRSGDPMSAPPSATLGIGKPAVVSGDIVVDITALLTPLPSGNYYAIVVSSGPGGSTPSAASAVISR